jgi:hypothetical protein
LFNTCAGLQTLDKGIFMQISFKETAKSCGVVSNSLTNMYTKWGSIEYALRVFQMDAYVQYGMYDSGTHQMWGTA